MPVVFAAPPELMGGNGGLCPAAPEKGDPGLPVKAGTARQLGKRVRTLPMAVAGAGCFPF